MGWNADSGRWLCNLNQATSQLKWMSLREINSSSDIGQWISFELFRAPNYDYYVIIIVHQSTSMSKPKNRTKHFMTSFSTRSTLKKHWGSIIRPTRRQNCVDVVLRTQSASQWASPPAEDDDSRAWDEPDVCEDKRCEPPCERRLVGFIDQPWRLQWLKAERPSRRYHWSVSDLLIGRRRSSPEV